jgi:hypothetical protein
VYLSIQSTQSAWSSFSSLKYTETEKYSGVEQELENLEKELKEEKELNQQLKDKDEEAVKFVCLISSAHFNYPDRAIEERTNVSTRRKQGSKSKILGIAGRGIHFGGIGLISSVGPDECNLGNQEKNSQGPQNRNGKEEEMSKLWIPLPPNFDLLSDVWSRSSPKKILK